MISLKFAMLRNSSKGLRVAGWIIGAVLVVATWAAAALSADDAVRHSVLTLVLAAWLVGGMFGPVLMSGAGVIRADYFALLPIPRAVLGRALLVTVFVGIAGGYVLLAALATVWHAAELDPAAIPVAVVGALLTWVLVVTMSRLVYGALGAAMRTRLGIEIAGVQWGVLLAAMFAGWLIVQAFVTTIPQLLADGLPAGPITGVLDAIPTSWPLLAIEAVAAGDAGRAVLLLAALAALDAVLVALTILLLVPRAQRVSRQRGRPRSVRLVAGGGILPATPTGAVIMKELRQWRRDPWRALESSTAVWTGATIGVFALVGGYTAPAAAFTGIIVALMVALSGCNLYGQDGSAVWQNVVGESTDSVRADVRGRQWAMVLVFLPRAALVSAITLVVAQAWWSLPYVAAGLPAILGAACGAAVLVSAIGVSPGVDPRRRVGPNDANGNISIHVWVSLMATAITASPTVGMAIWAGISGSPWVVAAMVVVGVANGFAAAWVLGRIAIGYLDERFVDVFSRIRYGRVFRAETGFLGSIAEATLKGENEALEYKQKAREKRLAERQRAASRGRSR